MNRPDKKMYKGQIVGYAQHLEKYIDYFENKKNEIHLLIKEVKSDKPLSGYGEGYLDAIKDVEGIFNDD